MPPRKIDPITGEFRDKRTASKKPPVPYVERETITKYKRDRNNYWLADLFTDEITKQQIRDIYGL